MSLLDHLWQSTLCAAVAALLTLALRRSSARTRHAIWLCASLKFLVPLSLFVAAGETLGAWSSSLTTPGVTAFIGWIDQSRAFWTIAAGARRTGADALPLFPLALTPPLGSLALTLTLIWASGVAALAAWRWRQWRELSRIARASAPLDEGREADALRRVTGVLDAAARTSPGTSSGTPPRPLWAWTARLRGRRRIALLLCDSAIEPGVLGISRPRLLWPSGLSDRLSDRELDAIVAHELSHVVRRDNLSALLQITVETVFWFHPLVWWIGARLASERERACDEEVLRMGIDNGSYAEGIVKVCGFCLRAPAALMAGLGGSDLAARIERIVRGPVLSSPTLPTRVLLAFIVSLTIGAPTATGVASTIRAPMRATGQDASKVERPGDDVTMPKVVHEVRPEYTQAAKKARIQGSVFLAAVVLETGSVGDVTVTRSLDAVHGLDEEAVAAMKQWRFEPGTKDKKPVPVRIEVEMTFTLK